MSKYVAVALCLASLNAQGGIYLVDANGGSAANFTDIQAAVLAVPDDSTLVVQPGSYAPVDIAAKGITILCAPNVVVLSAGPFLTVRNTQPQQAVTVAGLRGSGASGLLVQSAQGPVTYDGIGHSISVVTPFTAIPGLIVDASAQAVIRRVNVTGAPACRVTSSSVVFDRCILRGQNAGYVPVSVTFGFPAIQATNSSVQLAHSTAVGGDGLYVSTKFSTFSAAGDSAIRLVGTNSLRATGLSTHQIVGGLVPNGGGSRYFALAGSAQARVDSVMFMTTPQASPPIVLTRPRMPSVIADPAGVGATLIATRYGVPNVLCAMLISLRAPTLTVPGLADPIWVDAQDFLVESFAVTAGNGQFAVQKSVPNQPSLRGFQFLWQSAELDPSGLLAMSNPSPCWVN